jgi:hypothetical protein
VHGENLHRLDDARVAVIADQGDLRERLWGCRHGRVFSTL